MAQGSNRVRRKLTLPSPPQSKLGEESMDRMQDSGIFSQIPGSQAAAVGIDCCLSVELGDLDTRPD